MSASIAQSGLAAGRLLHRGMSKCSRTQFLRFRAQQQVYRPAMVTRGFSAGSRALEKRYTEDHEWIDTSDPENATIGISTYAAKALGDVVYVELPTEDMEVSKGDAIGAVESVKSASDIMTPVSGTIVAINNVLEDKPATINKSPEGEGWLAKIKVADVQELEALMDGEAYRKFTEEAGEK